MDTTEPAAARVTAVVSGGVQGVGFRAWVRAQATEFGLSGWATNTVDGRVEVVAEGSRAGCERLVALLEEQPATGRRPGRVTGVAVRWGEPRGESDRFEDR